jgi:D-galactose 1-dehydrogenase
MAFALCRRGRPGQGLAGRTPHHSVKVIWREDVRVWHPGQDWIWEPGGLGVFDPGINALSIITHILPRPFFLTEATLEMPENRAAPIAADLHFRDTRGAPIHMDLDWRQTGPQSWDVLVETDAGTLKLAHGGAVLTLPSETVRNEDMNIPASTPASPRWSRAGAAMSTYPR